MKVLDWMTIVKKSNGDGVANSGGTKGDPSDGQGTGSDDSSGSDSGGTKGDPI